MLWRRRRLRVHGNGQLESKHSEPARRFYFDYLNTFVCIALFVTDTNSRKFCYHQCSVHLPSQSFGFSSNFIEFHSVNGRCKPSPAAIHFYSIAAFSRRFSFLYLVMWCISFDHQKQLRKKNTQNVGIRTTKGTDTTCTSAHKIQHKQAKQI